MCACCLFHSLFMPAFLCILLSNHICTQVSLIATNSWLFDLLTMQPPEAMRGTTFSMATDVYSFGVVSVFDHMSVLLCQRLCGHMLCVSGLKATVLMDTCNSSFAGKQMLNNIACRWLQNHLCALMFKSSFITHNNIKST